MARRSRTTQPKETPAGAPAPASLKVAQPPIWRRHAIPLLVLWAAALLAYANSFRGGLVFDNNFVITQDTRIRQATAENIHLILTRDYWFRAPTGLYRPLTTLSYLFNYAILGNGTRVAGYHWINFALHAINIALVYLLGLLLLKKIWPAFAMAALWAVHPVLTESVTNIVGRADLLAAFGVLGGLLCYARSVLAPRRRALWWRLALLGAVAVGSFSKESGAVVIAAIFLYDLAFCRDLAWRVRVPGYLAAALPVAVYLMVRGQVLGALPVSAVPFTDNPLVGADFWTARLTAVKVLGKYLWLLIWPARLSCDYSYNQIPLFSASLKSWEDWQALLALLVYAGAAVLAVLSYRRAKPLFFFIGFFFAAVAPTANLLVLIGTIMAERTLYLPSVAIAGCLAWAGWNVWLRIHVQRPFASAAAIALLAAICVALGARTLVRNADWFDERSLWESAVATAPASYKTHMHLATLLAVPPANAFDDASREADRSIAILNPLPDDKKIAAAYATAGLCYRAEGDSLGPNGGPVWYQKAIDVLLAGRRADQAWDAEMTRRNRLEGKVVATTGWSSLYLELGRSYQRIGKYQDALEALKYGRRIDPQVDFFEEMSKAYQGMGDGPQAAVTLLEAITLGSSEQVRLAAEVVDVYKRTASQSCALAGSGSAAALNFDCPLVRSQFCAASRNVAVLYREMHRDHDAAATVAGAISGLGCPAEMFR